ncbi:MAG: RAD55 family ATPase [Thermoplasmata archaeon]
MGPPGVGKFEYCTELALNFLDRRGRVVFVAVDVNPFDVRRLAAQRGHDLLREKRFVFVHCISPYAQSSFCCENANSCCIKSETHAESIGAAIGEAISRVGKPIRVFLCTMSSLLLYNSPKDVIKLFHAITKDVKDDYGFAAFVLHSGIHLPSVQRILEAGVDGIIEWRYGGNDRRQYKVRRYRGLALSLRWRSFLDADFSSPLGGKRIDQFLVNQEVDLNETPEKENGMSEA